MSTPPSTQAASGRPGRYTRSFGGPDRFPRGAVCGIAGVFWLVMQVMSQSEPNQLRAVEIDDALASARSEAPFAVLAPEPIPAGWRPTSVSYEASGPVRTWRVGFHDQGSDRFVGLTQGNGSASELIDEATPADQPAGQKIVAGRRWEMLTQGDETALVWSGPSTVVLTGNVPPGQLAVFARSLAGR